MTQENGNKICSKNSRSQAKGLAQTLSDLSWRMLCLHSGDIPNPWRELEADPNRGPRENGAKVGLGLCGERPGRKQDLDLSHGNFLGANPDLLPPVLRLL